MKSVSTESRRLNPSGSAQMVQAHGSTSPGAGFVVVFDCESDCSLRTCTGNSNYEKISTFMQFTVCCAVTIPTDVILANAPTDEAMQLSKRYHWWRDEADAGKGPIDGMLSLFDDADAIVGYNCFDFDFPLIKRHYRCVRKGETSMQRYMRHRSKCYDIMAKVRDVTGAYFKLDDLLRLNKLSCKTSNGLKAIVMWEKQQRDDLKAYCAADVDLTARLALVDNIVVDSSLSMCPSAGLRFALSKRANRDRETRRAGDDDEFVLV